MMWPTFAVSAPKNHPSVPPSASAPQAVCYCGGAGPFETDLRYRSSFEYDSSPQPARGQQQYTTTAASPNCGSQSFPRQCSHSVNIVWGLAVQKLTFFELRSHHDWNAEESLQFDDMFLLSDPW